MKQNTLYFLKITFYISILGVYTSVKSASGNIQVYKGDHGTNWNKWQQELIFTRKNPDGIEEHVFTLWTNPDEEMSFSLMSHKPDNFEWVTNPCNPKERSSGPDIYQQNDFTEILRTSNQHTLTALQTKSGVGPMSARMYQLFLQELNKIIKYKTWIETNRDASNMELVDRVFKSNPKKKTWTLRKDAPNPLLAVEYYKLYKEFENIEQNTRRQTTV